MATQKPLISRADLARIAPGDLVTRVLGGIEMDLFVTRVADGLIHCGVVVASWTFDAATGIEVDDRLGWGPAYGVSGSYLTRARRLTGN